MLEDYFKENHLLQHSLKHIQRQNGNNNLIGEADENMGVLKIDDNKQLVPENVKIPNDNTSNAILYTADYLVI